ncbi:MAG: hypothetical protein AAFN93_29905, partial [Bacteroidota bacterium]
FWPRAIRNINDYWQPFFKENARFLKSIDNVGIQFSNVDNRFFTNVVLSQTKPPTSGTREVEEKQTLSLASKIITKPYIFKSHIDNSLEVFLQDSSLNAYLIDKNFKPIWSLQLPAKIDHPIFQIDYYNNDKLQLVFVSGRSLYIIDRNGTLLPGFPVQIPGLKDVNHFHVIDYDGSKNYRFSFADKNGNVILCQHLSGRTAEKSLVPKSSPSQIEANHSCPVSSIFVHP